MDGVIVDSEPLHLLMEKEVFARLQIPVTDEQHERFIGVTDSFMWKSLHRTYSIPYSVEELIEMKRKAYLEALREQGRVQLIDGAAETLARLYDCGIKLMLASSSPRDQVDCVLEKFGLEKYFIASVSGDEVKNGKPDPEIFIRAMSMLNLKSHHCVVVEDSRNGIIAAHRANVPCIGYINEHSPNQDLTSADTCIEHLNEITVDLAERLTKTAN
jgi:HAD superfamily hydrolase (TIGR01509 family)